MTKYLFLFVLIVFSLNAFSKEEDLLSKYLVLPKDKLLLSYNFELIDMTGKKVVSQSQNISGNNNKIILPTNSLSRGIYLLKIFNDNKLISKKIKL